MWSERQARMAICATVDAGEPEVARLVAQVGAQEAWARLSGGALGEPVARRAAVTDLEQVARHTERVGARFVVPGDEEWPASLDDLEHPAPVQNRGGVPTGLWLRGPGRLAAVTERSVAVVGSRAASHYGTDVAHDLAGDLAEAGWAVVSGLAFGIDVAAHRGALGVGGPTVGVVANGVDVAYPPGNRQVVDQVARDHLVVSELPPGAHPTRVRFLARNRLIAALSRGTVVVEAALRSGARNTAGWALELQRMVMAVPGPVHSRCSAAPHLMIRSGQATLVTCGAEVLELVAAVGSHTLATPVTPVRLTDRLSPSQLAVFEAVPARRRAGVGEIALAANLPVPSCLGALRSLEDAGLVEASPEGWRARPQGALRVVG